MLFSPKPVPLRENSLYSFLHGEAGTRERKRTEQQQSLPFPISRQETLAFRELGVRLWPSGLLESWGEWPQSRVEGRQPLGGG